MKWQSYATSELANKNQTKVTITTDSEDGSVTFEVIDPKLPESYRGYHNLTHLKYYKFKIRIEDLKEALRDT